MKLPQQFRLVAQVCSFIFIVAAAFASGWVIGNSELCPSALVLEWILITVLFGIGFLTEKENGS